MVVEGLSDVGRDLRALLAELPDGGRLPTVRQLMKQFGVGQAIIQRALDELTRDGLIRAEVGRGTFAIKPESPDTAAAQRSVVILNHENPGLRGEVIARELHRQLIERQHKPIVVTYSDPAHAADLVQALPAYDGCVLRPSGQTASIQLLSLLKRRTRAVVVEGMPLDGIDVDSIATDWRRCVELAAERLIHRGRTKLVLCVGDPDAMHARHGARHLLSIARIHGVKVRATSDIADIQSDEGVMIWGVRRPGDVARVVPTESIVLLDTIEYPSPDVDRFTTVGRRPKLIVEACLDLLETRWREPSGPYIPQIELPEITEH